MKLKNIVKETLKNGGSSTSLLNKSANGFMVSVKDCAIIPVNDFNVKALKKVITKNIELLSNPSNFLGTWIDNGNVYIDISESINDRETAIKLGKERHQLGIYDISNQQTIELI